MINMYDVNSLTNTVVPRHCRNLPEHFNLTPRTLQNPSKPQIRLQNAPEWNLQTFQSQNAVWTFRNFPRPRSSESKINLEKLATQRLTFNGTLPFRQANLMSKQGTPKAYHGHRHRMRPPPYDGRCCVGCTMPWTVPRPRHTRLWPRSTHVSTFIVQIVQRSHT